MAATKTRKRSPRGRSRQSRAESTSLQRQVLSARVRKRLNIPDREPTPPPSRVQLSSDERITYDDLHREGDGRIRYPWDLWLDGNTWEVPYEMYAPTSQLSFCQLAYRTAKRWGVRVEVRCRGMKSFITAYVDESCQ